MPSRDPAIWLLKTEPETYAFEQLTKDKRTNWDHVRNYQARNFLRTAQVGDLALIYHSGDAKAVVGLAHVTRSAYPDPDPETPGDWVQIDITADRALPHVVPLKTLKATPALKELILIKQSRLSVSPVTREQYEKILQLGGIS